jgi:hypothetical protein
MHRLAAAVCWLILGTWLVSVCAQSAEEPQPKLEGAWTAANTGRPTSPFCGSSLCASSSNIRARTASPVSARQPPLTQLFWRKSSLGKLT